MKLTNLQLAQNVLNELYLQGVRDICVCAGARNSVFLSQLSYANSLFNVYHFFEERCASFFALGKIKKNKKPVAVITTSGTAVANLLPAVVEAYYEQLPLVLITSDRPKSYRGSGAPQSIDQVGIFSTYVTKQYDYDGWDIVRFAIQEDPIHLNICFTGALHLTPVALDLVSFNKWKLKNDIEIPPKDYEVRKKQRRNEGLNTWQLQFFKNLLSSNLKPLVIIGELPLDLQKKAAKWLSKNDLDFFAEPLSGLQDQRSYEEPTLSFLSYDYVLRLGGVPLTSFWRNLEESKDHVVNISDKSFSGLSYNDEVFDIYEFFNSWGLLKIPDYSFKNKMKYNSYVINEMSELRKQIKPKTFSNSEPLYIKKLANIIPKKSHIFLANSLPIRLWSEFAKTKNKNFTYSANRGANGIDGIISSFLGNLTEGVENWLIIGDLSALYDLTALYALPQLKKYSFKIVIINNHGGQIFSKILKKQLSQFKNKNAFLTPHKLDFKNWAKMFSIDYLRVDSAKDLHRVKKQQQLVVEVITSNKQSQALYGKQKQLLRELL